MNSRLHDQRIRTNGVGSPETKGMFFLVFDTLFQGNYCFSSKGSSSYCA